MTPHVNEAIVQDRIYQPLAAADRRRLARWARANTRRRAGLRTFKETVGHGLIAIGSRLAVQDPSPEPSAVRRAA